MWRGNFEFLHVIAKVNVVIRVAHSIHLRGAKGEKITNTPEFAWRRTQGDLRQFFRNDTPLTCLLARVSEDFHRGDGTRAGSSFTG